MNVPDAAYGLGAVLVQVVFLWEIMTVLVNCFVMAVFLALAAVLLIVLLKKDKHNNQTNHKYYKQQKSKIKNQIQKILIKFKMHQFF